MNKHHSINHDIPKMNTADITQTSHAVFRWLTTIPLPALSDCLNIQTQEIAGLHMIDLVHTHRDCAGMNFIKLNNAP